MIIRVKIEDNLCTISPNTMLNNDEILFYPYIRNLLFNELYSNGELKDSFPKWFKSKRKLNEDKTLKSDRFRTSITYTYGSTEIPVIFWYDGNKYIKDLLGND